MPWYNLVAHEHIGFIRRNRSDFNQYSIISLWTLFLVLTHLYYNKDVTVVPDSFFDGLCNELLSRGGEEELKRKGVLHLKLASDDLFRAGSGFSITRRIPVEIELISNSYLDILKDEKII